VLVLIKILKKYKQKAWPFQKISQAFLSDLGKSFAFQK